MMLLLESDDCGVDESNGIECHMRTTGVETRVESEVVAVTSPSQAKTVWHRRGRFFCANGNSARMPGALRRQAGLPESTLSGSSIEGYLPDKL
jgi:hypothetical protein